MWFIGGLRCSDLTQRCYTWRACGPRARHLRERNTKELRVSYLSDLRRLAHATGGGEGFEEFEPLSSLTAASALRGRLDYCNTEMSHQPCG